jgi:putative transposase
VAIVLLPDHLHSVWRLPPGDDNYSLRWQKVKESFTRSYLASGGAEGRSTASRRRNQERAVWQRRFWEHTCRDEDDVKRCVDYVHWNPIKHRLARRVAEYPWSSFHRYVRLGEYSLDWGGVDPCPGFQPPE